MRENIARVAAYSRSNGLHLRPHAKSHKIPEIAQLQLDAGARGLTVATPKEAEVMAAICSDILVAYPPVAPDRIARLVRLSERVRLSVALDSMEALRRLQAGLATHYSTDDSDWARIDILVEVDLGFHRTGLSDSLDVVELARLAEFGPGTRFAGLMLYPGHVRNPAAAEPCSTSLVPSRQGPLVDQMSPTRTLLGTHLQAVRSSGLSCHVVSGGSTPTLFHSHLIPELTEIRPGSYVYGDRDIASRGIFGWSDCAYSVLATVVSTAVSGQAVVDAGSKAIGKGTILGLKGLGALLDRPEIVVSAVSEEHGILDVSRSLWKPRVGDRVQIVPNHICTAVNLHDYCAVIDEGEIVIRRVAARGH